MVSFSATVIVEDGLLKPQSKRNRYSSLSSNCCSVESFSHSEIYTSTSITLQIPTVVNTIQHNVLMR